MCKNNLESKSHSDNVTSKQTQIAGKKSRRDGLKYLKTKQKNIVFIYL